jgi:hypothetical protein
MFPRSLRIRRTPISQTYCEMRSDCAAQTCRVAPCFGRSQEEEDVAVVTKVASTARLHTRETPASAKRSSGFSTCSSTWAATFSSTSKLGASRVSSDMTGRIGAVMVAAEAGSVVCGACLSLWFWRSYASLFFGIVVSDSARHPLGLVCRCVCIAAAVVLHLKKARPGAAPSVLPASRTKRLPVHTRCVRAYSHTPMTRAPAFSSLTVSDSPFSTMLNSGMLAGRWWCPRQKVRWNDSPNMEASTQSPPPLP